MTVERRAGIEGRLLNSPPEGVLAVERGGGIAAANQAACRILGLSSGELTTRTFVELFVAREGLDAFTDFILEALRSEGERARQTVAVSVDGRRRSLSVVASRIGSNREGPADTAAVIAMFSDIAEQEEARDATLRMAEAIENQDVVLRDAGRQIEERTRTVTTLRKKIKAARAMELVLAIGLSVVVGVYFWQPAELFDDSSSSVLVSSTDVGPGGHLRSMAVQPRPFISTISLIGRLVPWRTVNIPSPIEGRIAAVGFQYGHEVRAGAQLVELDTGLTKRAYRQVQLAYIEAQQRFETVRDWESSSEMGEARRALTRAKLALEGKESQLRRSAFLLEQGLIPASQHEDTERQYRSQSIDFEAARRDLEAARANGGDEALKKAALVLSSVEEEMGELEAGLERATVHAPIGGIVLAPAQGDELTTGRSVKKGETLARIGDFTRMSATAKADEVDVVHIETGQSVEATGDAFPGLILRGTVAHVSSQARERSMGASLFDVVVTLEPAEVAQRSLLRVGMSTKLEIVVYRNEAALMVPIDAVERRGGDHRLWLIDPQSGEVAERVVEIGLTDLDSVEIVAGLKPGDHVAVPSK